MFLVPYGIVTSKNYKKKLDAKNLENQIFEDKIVNKKAEPTLFNIEAGLASVQCKTGRVDEIRQTRRAYMGNETKRPPNSRRAQELLGLINVSQVEVPRSFSLVYNQTSTETIHNPRIVSGDDYRENFLNGGVGTDTITMDSGPFQPTLTGESQPFSPGFDSGPFMPTLLGVAKLDWAASSTVDKFPSKNDPFYQLDESYELTKLQEATPPEQEKIKQVDLSHIAANFTILNNSNSYFGKNKYYKD